MIKGSYRNNSKNKKECFIPDLIPIIACFCTFIPFIFGVLPGHIILKFPKDKIVIEISPSSSYISPENIEDNKQKQSNNRQFKNKKDVGFRNRSIFKIKQNREYTNYYKLKRDNNIPKSIRSSRVLASKPKLFYLSFKLR